jgi:hypothetical protein
MVLQRNEAKHWCWSRNLEWMMDVLELHATFRTSGFTKIPLVCLVYSDTTAIIPETAVKRIFSSCFSLVSGEIVAKVDFHSCTSPSRCSPGQGNAINSQSLRSRAPRQAWASGAFQMSNVTIWTTISGKYRGKCLPQMVVRKRPFFLLIGGNTMQVRSKRMTATLLLSFAAKHLGEWSSARTRAVSYPKKRFMEYSEIREKQKNSERTVACFAHPSSTTA